MHHHESITDYPCIQIQLPALIMLMMSAGKKPCALYPLSVHHVAFWLPELETPSFKTSSSGACTTFALNFPGTWPVVPDLLNGISALSLSPAKAPMLPASVTLSPPQCTLWRLSIVFVREGRWARGTMVGRPWAQLCQSWHCSSSLRKLGSICTHTYLNESKFSFILH